MNLLSAALKKRCGSKCELCSKKGKLNTFFVAPKTGNNIGNQVAICKICHEQIENLEMVDITHWRCLSDSIWSNVLSVQVLSYRMLQSLDDQEWAQYLLKMNFMDDETLEWAEGKTDENDVHKDSYGIELLSGDNVVLIKNVFFKEAKVGLKRGTLIYNISLKADDVEKIEATIDGQDLVIMTEWVKKQIIIGKQNYN
jgi:protein PhnA